MAAVGKRGCVARRGLFDGMEVHGVTMALVESECSAHFFMVFVEEQASCRNRCNDAMYVFVLGQCLRPEPTCATAGEPGAEVARSTTEAVANSFASRKKHGNFLMFDEFSCLKMNFSLMNVISKFS